MNVRSFPFILTSQIDWHVLEERLKAVDGVQDVHDLHIWSISSNNTAMTVHIRVSTELVHSKYIVSTQYVHSKYIVST